MKENIVKLLKKYKLTRKIGGNILSCYYNFFADYLFISYPKTGRTWLRVLVGYYISLHFDLLNNKNFSTSYILKPRKFRKINKSIPYIFFSHDDKPHLKKIKNQKSNKKTYYNKNIIFLYRDPKATCVSQYFSLTKRSDKYFNSISDFVKDNEYGPNNYINYLNIWAKEKNNIKNILFISYEELLKNPNDSLIRILEFIGIKSVNRNFVKSAIEFSKFENLKVLEKSNFFDDGMLKPKNIDDKNSFKVREGGIDKYKKHLSNSDIEYLDNIISLNLDKFYKY